MAYGLLSDFLMGQCIEAHNYFGAHFTKDENGVDGVVFRLYAPSASDVSVIGDWNNWDVGANKMMKIDECGVWEVYIPQELAYGDRETGEIKPFSTLIFKIELVGIGEGKK